MVRKLIYIVAGAVALSAPAVSSAQTGSERALPADIDPESLSRLRALTRDELDAEGRAAWDLVVGDGPRPTSGPAHVSMYSPKIAEGFHVINSYLRSGDAAVEPRYYEVAILQAAWEFEQAYEWSAHEGAARSFGVPGAVIDAIKFDRSLEGLSEKDSVVIRFGRALFRDHRVSSELYADVVEHFGERGMVELATIMGDYVMAGLVLTAADQHLPASRPNTLPER